MLFADIPQGAVVAMYGRPGAGKTWIGLDLIGRKHAEDPDAIAVWFDTEFRMGGNDSDLVQFGVDPSRLLTFSVGNTRDVIENFDRVGDFAAEGAPIKIIVINTITSMQRPLDPEEPIGAMTMMLAALAKCARAHNITLVMIAHVRSNLNGLKIVPGYKPSPAGLDTFVDYMVEVDSPVGVRIEKVEKTDG